MVKPQFTERMSPLDLLMPGANIGTVLVFPTEIPHSDILARFQFALEKVCERIPWLKGRVVPTGKAAGMTAGFEIRWDAEDKAPRILNKGVLHGASYEDLAAANMPLDGIPSEAWPMESAEQLEAGSGGSGAPVFAASVFGFACGDAVGLCVQAHHNATDGFGFAAIIRLWGEIMSNKDSSSLFNSAVGRTARLDAVLDGSATTPISVDDLWARHAEYSQEPPCMPASFPDCTSEILTIPISEIKDVQDRLQPYLETRPSTNTVACALAWSAVMRARMQRIPDLASQTSRLPMAVNGRKRLDATLADPDDPYLGNAVLFALAETPAADLLQQTRGGIDDDDEASRKHLAGVVSAVAAALAPDRVDEAHVREVCELVRGVGDHRRIFPGWQLFGARDVFVTSWADLDFYELAFGEGLGRPRFVRIPYVQADGNIIILPRRRGDGADEVLELVVMSRRDDLEILKADAIWSRD
ncbi:Chloramphenicol acetyltransferase-like domain-containing protein [Cordyceps javanica]|uniref:Chloramphenicol acetyltransferase-like domain-containing protein n=1 Tax=Cordyceps javanica TaxID=43265 RepID=A0A545UTH6_9HYPO|nr:Chloramphenicol acetyltransferase-like domain-containing protein [Cordyceps javanica]TQW02089.1 Chloramphenicol acetyltransferase-like domain protein [Cordyceps javanica]